MILHLALCLCASLTLALALALGSQAIKSRLAWIRFSKQLKKTPMNERDRRLLGNSTYSMFVHKNAQRMHLRHQQLGKTIGMMVQERPAVSTVDLELIKRIVLDKAERSSNRLKLGVPLREYEQSILFAEDEQWRRTRRSFAPALKPARFRAPQVVREIESNIERLLHGLDRALDEAARAGRLGPGGSVELDVDDLMHRFSMSVVMSCFYKQHQLISFELGRPDRWVRMVEHALESLNSSWLVHLGFMVPAIRHLIDWASLHLLPVGEWRRGVLGFIRRQTALSLEARQLAERRRAAAAEHEHEHELDHELELEHEPLVLRDGTKYQRNLIDYIIDQYHAGKLAWSDYVNSSAFLFGAADKTAADALSYTLYQLALQPDVQRRLRAELRSGGAESPYLGWVLNESLRLNPPAPGGPSRTLAHDLQLDNGDWLRAGTFVLTPLYTIHRLSEYWGADAHEFRPERWARAHQHHHPCQFMPFGAGLRTCIGKEFAQFEIRLLLAALIQRYHFSLPSAGPKRDLDEFSSPMWIFHVQKTPFQLAVARLAASQA